MHLNMICLHEFASFLRNTLYINILIFKTPVRAFKYDDFMSLLHFLYKRIQYHSKTTVRAFKYDMTS
jgi:hypothetical protein